MTGCAQFLAVTCSNALALGVAREKLGLGGGGYLGKETSKRKDGSLETGSGEVD